MTPPKRNVRLGRIELFRGCTQRELRWIGQHSTTRDLAAGRMLCRKGELGRECFVVLDGHVEVSFDGFHETYERGALVGETALFTPDGRSTATVTAVTDVSVLAFTRSEFRQLLAALPTVAHRILRAAARRLVDDAGTYWQKRAPANRASVDSQSIRPGEVRGVNAFGHERGDARRTSQWCRNSI